MSKQKKQRKAKYQEESKVPITEQKTSKCLWPKCVAQRIQNRIKKQTAKQTRELDKPKVLLSWLMKNPFLSKQERRKIQ